MATQVDLGKIRPVWKGDWAASTAYEQNDMVKVGVDSYICTVAHTSGSTFADTNWDVLAVGAEIPSQSGNAGKSLVTDGSALSWGDSSIAESKYYYYGSQWSTTSTAWVALPAPLGDGTASIDADAGDLVIIDVNLRTGHQSTWRSGLFDITYRVNSGSETNLAGGGGRGQGVIGFNNYNSSTTYGSNASGRYVVTMPSTGTIQFYISTVQHSNGNGLYLNQGTQGSYSGPSTITLTRIKEQA